ncbi:hypothetical protein Trydic_g15735 [Trypoxylus dichotomus]
MTYQSQQTGPEIVDNACQARIAAATHYERRPKRCRSDSGRLVRVQPRHDWSEPAAPSGSDCCVALCTRIVRNSCKHASLVIFGLCVAVRRSTVRAR